MSSRGDGIVEISSKSMRTLIEDEGNISLPENAEIVFGDFKLNTDGSFAWDNGDCHPSEWATGKPVWLTRMLNNEEGLE